MGTSDKQAEVAKRVFSPLIAWTAGRSLDWIEEHIARSRQADVDPTSAYTKIVGRVVRSERVAEALIRMVEHNPRIVCELAVGCEILSAREYATVFGEPPRPFTLEDLLMAQSRADKFECFETLVKDQPVLVHLDPRRENTAVPAQFLQQSRLVLRFGHNLVPPCENFDYDEDRVSARLSFGGEPFDCSIPWDSVFVIIGASDNEMRVWSESAPEDLSEEDEGRDSQVAASEAPAEKPRVPHLKLVE